MKEFSIILITSFVFFTLLFNDSLKEYAEQKYHNNINYDNVILNKFSEFKAFLEEDVFYVKSKPSDTIKQDSEETDESIQELKEEKPSLELFTCRSFNFYYKIQKEEPIKKVSISKNDGIIILGDSLMQGVGVSICNHAKTLGLKCKNIAKQSTGILRKKYYNYAVELDNALRTTNYKTIVILVGLNDTWDGRYNQKTIKFATKNWIDFYKSRVSELAMIAKKYKANLFWYELPIIKEVEQYEKVKLVNSIFEEQSKIDNFHFIKLDLILTEHFNYYIQYENKSRRIRLNDGVHFTPLGYSLVSKSFFDMVSVE